MFHIVLKSLSQTTLETLLCVWETLDQLLAQDLLRLLRFFLNDRFISVSLIAGLHLALTVSFVNGVELILALLT